MYWKANIKKKIKIPIYQVILEIKDCLKLTSKVNNSKTKIKHK